MVERTMDRTVDPQFFVLLNITSQLYSLTSSYIAIGKMQDILIAPGTLWFHTCMQDDFASPQLHAWKSQGLMYSLQLQLCIQQLASYSFSYLQSCIHLQLYRQGRCKIYSNPIELFWLVKLTSNGSSRTHKKYVVMYTNE